MKNFKKVLSLVLVAVMVIGALVVAPKVSADGGTYTKVTEVSALKEGGNFVIIAASTNADTNETKYYAMNVVDGGWLTATEVTAESETIPVIQIAASGDNFTLKTSGGDSICATYSTAKDVKNKVLTDATAYTADWAISEVGTDTFAFLLTGNTDTETPETTNRYLAFAESSAKFRCYLNSTITGYTGYVAEFMIYEYEGENKTPQNIVLEDDATPEEILAAAYEAIEKGVKLEGTWELTGVVKSIDTAYDSGYKNVSVTMQIGDNTEQLMGCYRLTVADKTDEAALAELADIKIGDTITVEGTIGSYNGKAQFTQGCVLKALEKAQDRPQDIELEADATPEEILAAAYEAIEKGVKVLGTWELTGVITSIDTAYDAGYKNVSVTMQIGDNTEQLMGCFRLTVADKTDEAALAELAELAVGDTITVKGELGSYNGKAQFVAGSTLEKVVKASTSTTPDADPTPSPETGDNMFGAYVVLGASALALAVVEFKKRR